MRRYMNSSKTSPTKLSPKSLHHGWKRQTLRGNFVKALPSQFESFPWFSTPYMQRKTFTSSTSSFKDDNRPASISIGDITGQVKQPQNPHLVPSAGNTGELLKELTNEEISHLRWMLQKDQLGQDIFLLGLPGSERRRLALFYCQLLQREVEFLSLSRDTTESDLKQRREIEHKESYFTDQAPVRAALNGRVLIIDGIEKAERNVLPTLNNLLENREMSLDDGRFLVSPEAWKRLSEHHGTTKDSLAVGAHTLVKVHEDFRVIALGLPSPPFPGKPLDPPLRSRFQARFISPKNVTLGAFTDKTTQTASTNVASFQATYTYLHADSLTNASSGRLPPFPAENAQSLVRHMDTFPADANALGDLLHRAFPFTIMDDVKKNVLNSLQQQSENVSKSGNTASSRWGVGWAKSFDAFSGHVGDNEQAGAREDRMKTKISNALRTDVFNLFQNTSCYFYHINPMSFIDVAEAQAKNVAPQIVSQADPGYSLRSVEPKVDGQAIGHFESKLEGVLTEVALPCGPQCLKRDNLETLNSTVMLTGSYRNTMVNLIQDHALGHDLCLIGDKGVGKSVIAQTFADILGYDTELIPLYADMSARDLLQKRSIDSHTGNTIWTDSPLVNAALTGKLCVLDGLHTIAGDVLSTLQRLCTDRELDLFSGNRLVPQKKWDLLREHNYIDETGRTISGESKTVRILPIHPSFRILGLSKQPSKGLMSPETVSSSPSHAAWFHPEALSMFRFHLLGKMVSLKESESIVAKHCPSLDGDMVEKLCSLNTLLSNQSSNSSTGKAEGLPSSLSLRQLVKLGKRCEIRLQELNRNGGDLNIREDVHTLLLTRFSPSSVRSSIDGLLRKANLISKQSKGQSSQRASVDVDFRDNDDGTRFLKIGNVQVESFTKPKNEELVPHPTFYDIHQHKVHLKNMLADLKVGEKHLLLIGNQGTGKNMLADQMLHLINGEREYMQLHRDSTVGALTLTPALVQGKLVWEDSPLVRAAREGRTLVLDEADKAPTEVVSIVKSLIEDGQMLLADGRRIVDLNRYHVVEGEEDTIPLHSEFRLWVLANRPGWPFLGNDFFRECGDIFSIHVIDNPDIDSEVALLQSYAPSLETESLVRLAKAFSKLREEHEKGSISYPYSTREAVAVVKHLSRFESDRVGHALENVLAFDALDPHLRKKVAKIFSEQGFDVADSSQATLGFMRSLWELRKDGKDPKNFCSSPPPIQEPKHGQVDDEQHVGGSTYAGGSGGSNTAGLGGRGGPYRLDKGHPVHQVPEDMKKDVPPEVQERAREMAKDAFNKRLEEIKMSEGEMSMYTNLLEHVGANVHALRNVLEAAEIKNEERMWKKNQTHGELDDAKIVDGVTGEKNIYKRRIVEDIEENSEGDKKIKLQFVLDVSGSMYRFNNEDGRLNRLLETTAMIMESFQGFEDRFDYSIVGHSGDSERISLVEYGSPPQNEKERLTVLQTMVAHTQFCMPGDHTIEATERSINEMSAKEDNSSGRFVFIVSDANLRRYNIPPEELAEQINRATNSSVEAYAIFIASIADEAHRVANTLPSGRGFAVFDTSSIPSIFQNIFIEKFQ